MINFMDLPRSVKYFIRYYDGWIVGGAADPDRDIDDIGDVDVIIPFSRWHASTSMIPEDAKRNGYGGWKFEDEGMLIDVWPDDLNNFMSSHMVDYLWQPRLGLRYKKF